MTPAEREKQIGMRFRQGREDFDMSQAGLAHQLGLTRDQLANIESGRTFLRYQTADLYCLILGFSQRWLATGEEPMCPYVTVPVEEFPDRALFEDVPFSRAYDVLLAKHCHAFFKLNLDTLLATLASLGHWPTSAAPDAVKLQTATKAILDYLSPYLSPRLHSLLFRTISDACVRFIGNVTPEIAKHLESVAKGSSNATREPQKGENVALTAKYRPPVPTADTDNKTSLTGKAVDNSVSSMPRVSLPKTLSSWPELREQLNLLTSDRGGKAKLARRWGVTPQAASDWLRAVYSPDADMTFQLLRWVESGAAERELRSGASSAPAPIKSDSTDVSKAKSGQRAAKRKRPTP